ncbi:MAG TPA: hypothetical protein VL334_13295 [Anaerolineae bacterium]|nr:hypothetical protein [Anaerolineae bacterium]
MLKTMENPYRDRIAELAMLPDGVPASAHASATSPQSGAINLRLRSIDVAKAADRRARSATYAEGWGSLELAVHGS